MTRLQGMKITRTIKTESNSLSGTRITAGRFQKDRKFCLNDAAVHFITSTSMTDDHEKRTQLLSPTTIRVTKLFPFFGYHQLNSHLCTVFPIQRRLDLWPHLFIFFLDA